MDTNDNKPHDAERDLNDNTNGAEPFGKKQMNYSQQPQSAQDGQYGYYPPELQRFEPHSKPKRKGKIAAIIVLIILCLTIGGVFTSFVILPVLENIKSNVTLFEKAQIQGNNNAQAQSAEEASPQAEKEALTTDSPNIGGQAPDIDDTGNPIVQIAKEVGPAVVGVTVSVDEMNEDQELFAIESGYGTGIILSHDGYIVTNNHVIARSDSVEITLIDGQTYPASIVGADASTDIAVLKIEASGLVAAAFGDSQTLQVGETVVAIGNPLGSDLAGSVTSGIVSALNREITTNGYSQKYLQTDAAINPGNSGGALVNISGKVIGINTLKSYLAGYDDYGMPIGTEGIGFAIPISTAIPIIEQLMQHGQIERPGIGITCLVDVENSYNPSDAPDGVTVLEVVIGGPADTAGITPNDIITSIDGVEVATVEELTTVIKIHEIGDMIDVTVWREGEEYKSKVEVGDLNDM